VTLRRVLALGAVLGQLSSGAWAQPSEALPYRLDPTHTSVHWEVVHMGTSTSRGRFDRISGQTRFLPGLVLDVSIEVQTASVSTGIAVFDTMLKRSSLLDVATHPVARFQSERVEWQADGLTPARVHGRLSMKGREQPLTLHMTRWRCGNNVLFGREVCGGDFNAQLSRRAWDMDMAASMVEDTVTLRIQVEAIRQEPGDAANP
jgi:polyisoprenoid-binding protein YceI